MGVLSLTNFFNHSCAPNVRLFYDDSKAKFITLRPIKKGEQLFIGYNVEFWHQPVEDRRAALYKKRIHLQMRSL
jgi:SET domain-containing protein